MIPTKQITVMLAEDHAIVRQGLCALLNADGHFKMVGRRCYLLTRLTAGA